MRSRRSLGHASGRLAFVAIVGVFAALGVGFDLDEIVAPASVAASVFKAVGVDESCARARDDASQSSMLRRDTRVRTQIVEPYAEQPKRALEVRCPVRPSPAVHRAHASSIGC